MMEIVSTTEEDFRRQFGTVPGGEGTVFPVWRRGDRMVVDEPSVLAVGKVRGAAIVHISDLHFGDDFGFPESAKVGETPLLDILTQDIERLGVKPAIVIVSGDITTRFDTDAMLGPALDFLLSLAEAWDLQRNQVVIVPGNHDIPLHKFNAQNYSHERMYRIFLQNFYDARTETVNIRRLMLESGLTLEVLLLNSVRLRTPELKEYGYAEWPLCEPLLKSVEVPKGTVRIAVLHHHLVPAPLVEIPDPKGAPLSVTIDAGQIIEGLQRFGFSFVFHGHQHLPHIWRLARGMRTSNGNVEIRWPDRFLYAIGAGSAGARADRILPLRQNTYNLLRLEKDNWRYRVRQYNAGMRPEDYIPEQVLP